MAGCIQRVNINSILAVMPSGFGGLRKTFFQKDLRSHTCSGFLPFSPFPELSVGLIKDPHYRRGLGGVWASMSQWMPGHACSAQSQPSGKN